MSALLQALLGFLGGMVGRQGAGAAITNNAITLAALAPAAYWFLAHKEETAVCFTWGQLGIGVAVLVLVLKVAHRAPPPPPIYPPDWRGGA